jgi:hypothetical protein
MILVKMKSFSHRRRGKAGQGFSGAHSCGIRLKRKVAWFLLVSLEVTEEHDAGISEVFLCVPQAACGGKI